jgi:hypothetical protein
MSLRPAAAHAFIVRAACSSRDRTIAFIWCNLTNIFITWDISGADADGEAVHVYIPSLADGHLASDTLEKLLLLEVGIHGWLTVLETKLTFIYLPSDCCLWSSSFCPNFSVWSEIKLGASSACECYVCLSSLQQAFVLQCLVKRKDHLYYNML